MDCNNYLFPRAQRSYAIFMVWVICLQMFCILCWGCRVRRMLQLAPELNWFYFFCKTDLGITCNFSKRQFSVESVLFLRRWCYLEIILESKPKFAPRFLLVEKYVSQDLEKPSHAFLLRRKPLLGKLSVHS